MKNDLEDLARLIRYFILVSTTEAGSGHPTTSLSAVELTTTLFFGGFFRFDLKNKANPANDRLIFSKGHGSPLLYALYAAAGAVSETELLALRKFGSPLEGHPSMSFEYTEVPTGSLGQGLSAGVGMALNAKYLDKIPYNTFVLLGDGEMAEGSNWEAIQVAGFYKLNSLIGIIDVNRLGQSRETMEGSDALGFEKRISAFGWKAIVIDGHNFSAINKAYKEALLNKKSPTMIIAKTKKGKGISFWEDKEGWHGRPLPKEELEKAIAGLGPFDKKIRGRLTKPSLRAMYHPVTWRGPLRPRSEASNLLNGIASSKTPRNDIGYKLGEMVATRKAYGNALVRIYPKFPEMVVMDGETSNSTYSEIFAKEYPERYFEMFIAEQNMVGSALGFSARGKIPFISTFAAFFSRAHDQIRMSQYANSNIKFCGSHAGVSIGEDGPSQMGLEDLAMFRALLGSVVLYPSDAVSADKLTEEAARHIGNVYIRTTRKETPVIYKPSEKFPIGGSKVLRSSPKDVATVIGAGVTLHEALKAYEELKFQGILVRVIDLYSIKPLDEKTLLKAAKETKAVITVEDHFKGGGLGETVAAVLSGKATVHILAVLKKPMSGKPEELLDYEGISAKGIEKMVRKVI